MSDGLSMRQAAEQLGVSYSTLKGWLDRLDLNIPRNARGEYRITPEALNILETIKSLRSEDLGLDTIERRIGSLTAREPLAGTEPVDLPGGDTSNDSQVSDTGAAHEPLVLPAGRDPESAGDTTAIVAAIRAELQAQTELAERYARAAHRVGELEATVRHLEAQAGDASDREQAALDRERAARERLAATEAERDEVRRRAEEAEARARRLEEALAQPWYKRWFGR